MKCKSMSRKPKFNSERSKLIFFVLILLLVVSPGYAQESYRRWRNTSQVLRDKLDHILPEVMRENNIDMWIIMCREGNFDPMYPLGWINRATDPNLGASKSFNALSTKAGLLSKLNRQAEADKAMASALESASSLELHQYGRRLLSEKKAKEAMAVFERNYKQNKGAWPTNVGMMRGYSAMGDLKKALEHARQALAQAPDDINKRNLEQAVKTLESGKAL